MIDVVKIASYICCRYQEEYGLKMDEMKLHKLLYFTQRECIAQTDKPMFDATFYAWMYGPVLPDASRIGKNGKLHICYEYCFGTAVYIRIICVPTFIYS